MLQVQYRGATKDSKLRFAVLADERVMGHIELDIKSDTPVTLDDIRAIDLEKTLTSVPRHLTPWLIRPRETEAR